MIDPDRSGLIAADEATDGGGGGRQDPWLATCCQAASSHRDPDAPRLAHLPLLLLLPTCCLWPPPPSSSAAALPPATQASYANTHTHITHVAHKCRRWPRSEQNKHEGYWTHTHTHTVSITVFVHENLQLRSFITHVCSWQSFSQSGLHYCDYDIKPPPAQRLQDIRKWGEGWGGGLF